MRINLKVRKFGNKYQNYRRSILKDARSPRNSRNCLAPQFAPSFVPSACLFSKRKGKETSEKGLIVPFHFVQDILDKINGTSGSPLPPMSMMPKWRVFVPSRLHGPDDWNCGRCAKWLIFRLGPQGLGQILVVSEYKIYCVALILCHE